MSPTPILDLEQLPPKPPKTWLPRIIGVILGLAISVIFILEDQGRLPDWHWPAFNGLLLIPTLYLAIAVHEIGHLAAGLLAGFNMGGIAIGAFVLARSGRNWVFKFDRRHGLSSWLRGFFKPLTTGLTYHRSRYAWMVAGGPLASLLLTLFCGWFCTRYGSGFWNCVGALFWSSLFITLISLVPFAAGLHKSDGARLWELARHPERTRLWMAVLELQTEEAHGLRPREWSPHLFALVLTVKPSAREYLYCQLMAFYRRLEENDPLAALEHLENALSKSAYVGKVVQQGLYLEAASASARIGQRAAQAHTWRDRACRLRKPESLHAVDAEIAHCEQRFADAAQHWQAARLNLDRRKLDSGLIRFAKEKWLDYETACQSALSSPLPQAASAPADSSQPARETISQTGSSR